LSGNASVLKEGVLKEGLAENIKGEAAEKMT